MWLTPLRTLIHSHEHVEILVIKNELLFFKQRDGPYIPTLRLLHKCMYKCVHLLSVVRFYVSLLYRPNDSAPCASGQGSYQVCVEWSQHHVPRSDLPWGENGHCPT